MKTVWKFPIPTDDIVNIEMPQGAKVLHVDEQHGTPTMWALVDPNRKTTIRTFRFAGTGHPIDDGHADKFIGTFLLRGGSLVFHIFEILPVHRN